MRTIYAIQLQIIPNEGESSRDCFGNLVAKISSWVESKYQRAWNKTVSPPWDGSTTSPMDGHALCGALRSVKTTEMCTLQWSHPDDGDPSTAWLINGAVARHDDGIQLAILLRISTTRVVLRPVRFDLGRPRFVSDLLMEYKTRIDEWPVPTNVEHVASPQVQSFVDNVLLNDNRNLPVIVVSPDARRDDVYAVDRDALFQGVKGFAHVTVLADKWTAFKLTDIVQKPLSCYNGAVRIYWPGFTLDDNPFQHKLFLPQSIHAHEVQGLPLPRHLFRTLAAVASFRYTEGTVIRNARQVFAELEKQQAEELRHQVQTGSVEKAQLEIQLLEALERIDHLTAERDRYKDDLVAQQAAWAEVQQALNAGDSVQDEPQAETQAQFSSVAEAVRQASTDFAGPLVFLDSAFKSAKGSPYKDPNRVYQIFEALALIATEWRDNQGRLGRSWNEAVRDLGFDLRDQLSKTTKGQFGLEYTFTYKGEPRLFERHITIGAKQPDKCLSVHWFRDDDDLVLVIGHCGRHLTNTKA